MDFFTKEEADAALMKYGPNNSEVYDAHRRFYYEKAYYPGEIELGGHLSPQVVEFMAESLRGRR